MEHVLINDDADVRRLQCDGLWNVGTTAAHNPV